jgi:heterodisulfide reductase subunit B
VKAAVFYGCHLLKPSELRPWNSVERPTFLDEMVKALGAESVPYRNKMMCCGAGGGVRSGALDVSLDIARERLESMEEAGAECIIDVCPFCHLQFDIGQKQIAMKLGKNFNIPVIYYTQLLGLAMGFNPEELGIHMNETSSKSLIEHLPRI